MASSTATDDSISPSYTTPERKAEASISVSLQYTTCEFEVDKSTPISSARIVAVIHDFIHEERKCNFSFLGRYSHCYKDVKELLVVEPAVPSNAAGVKQKTFYLGSAEWLTFTEPVARSHRTVIIKVLDEQTFKIQSMLIGMDAESMYDAATWMRNTYCTDFHTPAKFSAMEYEEQNWWWATTGKTFPLLQLPLELRENIYLEALGPICVPRIVDMGGRDKVVLGKGLSFPGRSKAENNRDPDIPRPNLEILRINKQVRKEAMTVANRVIVKRFTTVHLLPESATSAERWYSPGLLARSSFHGISFLRRIQLEMTAAEYFASIGIRPSYHDPLSTGPPEPLDFKTLTRFNGLKQLDLHFISSKHKLARCPWDLSLANRTLHSCQKKWINLFFVLAWDALHELRTHKGVAISMSGCIKNSTRRYWKENLDRMSADCTALVKEMEEKARTAMMKHGSSVVLRCECTNPCAVKTAASERSTFADSNDAELSRVEGWQDMLDTAYWDFED